MPRSIVVGSGRSSEDELSAGSTVINGASYVRPDVRHQLPLIDQERCGLIENEVRHDFGGGTLLCVNVESHFRSRLPECSGGLATRLRPLDENRAGRLESRRELAVGDSRPVRHGGAPLFLQALSSLFRRSYPV